MVFLAIYVMGTSSPPVETGGRGRVGYDGEKASPNLASRTPTADPPARMTERIGQSPTAFPLGKTLVNLASTICWYLVQVTLNKPYYRISSKSREPSAFGLSTRVERVAARPCTLLTSRSTPRRWWRQIVPLALQSPARRQNFERRRRRQRTLLLCSFCSTRRAWRRISLFSTNLGFSFSGAAFARGSSERARVYATVE